MEENTAAPLQRMALGIDEAAAVVGVGRSKIYESISAGELKSLKVGGRRLILPVDLSRWLEAHRAA